MAAPEVSAVRPVAASRRMVTPWRASVDLTAKSLLTAARSARDRGDALHEHLPFARIPGEPGGALELGAGLGEAAELGEEIAAHARQQVVSSQRWLRGQAVDDLETGRRPRRQRQLPPPG